MKPLLTLLILLLSIPAAAQHTAFRAMTFNIRYAGPQDTGAANWEQRKEHVASVLRFNKVAVAGLQEALLTQIDDLKYMLPGWDWYGVGREDGEKKGEYAVIFYDAARFELLDSGSFWLSETPGEPSMGWDAAFERICGWVKLRSIQSGESFYFFNTHFDHKGEQARINSAKLILEKTKEIAGAEPVIVTGDFNASEETEVYRLLNGGPLQEASERCINPLYGTFVTWNGFGDNVTEGAKIDHIFVSDEWTVTEYGVIGERFKGSYPSDHMPVLAEVILE